MKKINRSKFVFFIKNPRAPCELHRRRQLPRARAWPIAFHSAKLPSADGCAMSPTSVFFSHPDVNFLLSIFFKRKFSSLGPTYFRKSSRIFWIKILKRPKPGCFSKISVTFHIWFARSIQIRIFRDPVTILTKRGHTLDRPSRVWTETFT